MALLPALYALADGDVTVPAPPHCTLSGERPEHAETMADWLESVVKIRTGNEEFYRLLVPMLRCLRQTAVSFGHPAQCRIIADGLCGSRNDLGMVVEKCPRAHFQLRNLQSLYPSLSAIEALTSFSA